MVFRLRVYLMDVFIKKFLVGVVAICLLTISKVNFSQKLKGLGAWYLGHECT